MEKKVILITGASSGMGKEAARILAEQGNIVYGAARRVDRMDDLKALGAQALEMDVTDDASMKVAVEKIISEQDRIDVLVNNAGYGSYGSVEDVPLAEARHQFEVNIFGLARLTQLVLPEMRKQGSGRIINISSMGGKFGEPNGAWYHATKFALEGFSDCLRMEVKQFGIDVVVIQPGAIKTEWTEIAREKMLENSGQTAYAKLANKQAQFFANLKGSEPIVVAKVIAKAAVAHRPRTRYAVGQGARLILFARSILSDRMFDALMLKVYG